MSEIDGIERLSRYLAGEMSEAEAKAIAEALSTQRDMGVALERLRALDRLVAEVASEVRRPAADPVIARAIARGEPRRVDLRRWLPVAVAVAVLVTMTIVLRPESAPPAPTAVLTGQAAEIAPGSIVDDPRTVGELPIVDAGSPARGAADAPLTIVEFADFECPFCRRAEQPLTELGAAYEGRVRLVFKHFPMPFHPYAHAASRAAIAAHVQGRFWDYAARLFAEKRALDDVLLITHAQALGLDVVRFRSDIASAGTQAQLDADVAEGKRLGVEGVPTFFINGRKVTGARTKEEFKAIIDEELALVRDGEDLYRAGFHRFIRGDYEEAFKDWSLGVERSPRHRDILHGLMRLENIAERLLLEADRDPDTTSACQRMEEVTRLTRAKSPLHERAQGGLRARCR